LLRSPVAYGVPWDAEAVLAGDGKHLVGQPEARVRSIRHVRKRLAHVALGTHVAKSFARSKQEGRLHDGAGGERGRYQPTDRRPRDAQPELGDRAAEEQRQERRDEQVVSHHHEPVLGAEVGQERER
jgi:hypothetical protein